MNARTETLAEVINWLGDEADREWERAKDGMTARQAPDPAQAARLWNLGQGGERRAKNLEDRLNAA